MPQIFTTSMEIAWADCDPAGIVFYPHFFRFMDTAFHRLLAARGTSQADLQRRFGIVGTPIGEANARFRSPGRPGDMLVLSVASVACAHKTFRVDYAAAIGDRAVFEGFEVRLFAAADGEGRMRACALPDAFKALFG